MHMLPVGRRIAYLRKKKGFTQAAFAKRLKWSPSVLCKIELGRQLPDTAQLEKVARVLGTTLAEFFSEEIAAEAEAAAAKAS
jgi:transcriptional regulator with XRE-family HTH domain